MAEKSKSTAKPTGEQEVLAAIADMPEPDREIAQRLHQIICDSAPELSPRLWYKQPAYAKGGKGGKVVCFFRGAAVDQERYLTLGFSGDANLDDGQMWPTAYAITGIADRDATHIAELVKRAAG